MWTMPTPCARRARMMRKSSSISVLVRAAVGSSMMRTEASSERALAISTICCCATLRSRTLARGSSLRWSRSMSSAVSSTWRLSSTVKREAAARLAAHVDVLGDGEVRGQDELLVDHADAQVAAGSRVRDVHLLALEPDGAGILAVDAGQDLHERRLAGAVLADERMHLPGAQLELGVHQVPGRPGSPCRCPPCEPEGQPTCVPRFGVDRPTGLPLERQPRQCLRGSELRPTRRGRPGPRGSRWWWHRPTGSRCRSWAGLPCPGGPWPRHGRTGRRCRWGSAGRRRP